MEEPLDDIDEEIDGHGLAERDVRARLPRLEQESETLPALETMCPRRERTISNNARMPGFLSVRMDAKKALNELASMARVLLEPGVR